MTVKAVIKLKLISMFDRGKYDAEVVPCGRKDQSIYWSSDSWCCVSV